MKKIIKIIKSSDIFQQSVEMQISRTGILDGERDRDSKQGSFLGGIISIVCVSLLVLQSISLVSTMLKGSNDIIKNGTE